MLNSNVAFCLNCISYYTLSFVICAYIDHIYEIYLHSGFRCADIFVSAKEYMGPFFTFYIEFFFGGRQTWLIMADCTALNEGLDK